MYILLIMATGLEIVVFPLLYHMLKRRGQGLSYNGIKLWNNLPSHIKLLDEKSEFKTKCKAHMMKKMYDSEISDYIV